MTPAAFMLDVAAGLMAAGITRMFYRPNEVAAMAWAALSLACTAIAVVMRLP